jgi:hypothetical protein
VESRFDLFQNSAKKAVVLAQNEARGLGHPWVGTAHLLLGLFGKMAGTPGPGESVYRQHSLKVAESVGTGHAQIHAAVVRLLRDRGPGLAGHIPLTTTAKTVLTTAPIATPRCSPDGYIGTPQLLLALLDAKAADPPAPKRTLRDRKSHLVHPATYDIGQRLLIDAAGSLERVREALYSVASHRPCAVCDSQPEPQTAPGLDPANHDQPVTGRQPTE